MGDSEQHPPLNPTNANILTRRWPVQAAPFAPDIGVDCSLALDKGRNPRIACWQNVESANAELLLVRLNDDDWEKETVAAARGARAALALDRNDDPWIAFYAPEAGALRVAHRQGANWTIEDAATGLTGFAAARPSIALSHDGAPHICALSGRGLELAIRQSDGTWRLEVVDAELKAGTDCSLAIDTLGAPHIACFDLDRQALRYARRVAGNWRLKDVEVGAADFAGEHLSLAVDAASVAHIGYWSLSGLKYARLLGDPPWSIETVEAGGGIGLYASIGIDGAKRPHIGYYDSVNGDLKYALRNDGQWLVRTVDATEDVAGNVGGYASIVVDEFNAAHIAYYDWQARTLKITHSNRAPRIANHQHSTFVNRSVSGDLLRSALDPEGDTLIVNPTPIDPPRQGTVAIGGDGKFRYTPLEGFNGTDAFRYEISDPLGARSVATVTIRVEILELAERRLANTPTQDSRIKIDFTSGVAAKIELSLEKKDGEEWNPVPPHRAPLNRFEPVGALRIQPNPNELGTGPYRLTFRVFPNPGAASRFAREGYVLARTAEFQFPRRGQRLELNGSLVDSEGPLQ